MQRISLEPRPHWEFAVRKLGFSFHTIDGEKYWDESACYAFSVEQIDHLEEVTQALESMCLSLVDKVIKERLYHRLQIPENAWSLIENSWNYGHKNLYGRFDFSYDGKRQAKLLEYNADTPTALLEASVVQWEWLRELYPDADQFNSIHEKLIEAWQSFGLRSNLIHFACMSDSQEDSVTVDYLRDTAMQAGFETAFLDMRDIGWNGSQFVDLDEEEILTLFKLYPWEWMVQEEFAEQIMRSQTLFIEPAWKMILSNKGMLALLWEMYPDHPNLLPTSFDPNAIKGHVVRKPLLSREGANVDLIASNGAVMSTDGPYGMEGFIYQQSCPLPEFDGNYPVIGSWVIASKAAGMGIREDTSPITGNASRFIPHYFV